MWERAVTTSQIQLACLLCVPLTIKQMAGIEEPFMILLMILWMEKILHHLRDPGVMIALLIPTNTGFPRFPSGAVSDVATIHSAFA